MHIDEPESSLLDGQTEAAIRATLSASGMPLASLSLYARWWQLETWLRQLVYVELRALYGQSWRDAVLTARGRQSIDATFRHMAGADNENPLAYLDYSQLLKVVEEHWKQCEYALLEKSAWTGRQTELMRIRHRIGHVRKAHQDDLNRLEQTLRDLEHGTFIALASYNDQTVPDPSGYPSTIVDGWLRGAHPVAQRLLEHARERYDTRFALHVSRRPWSPRPTTYDGTAGVLWHVDYFMGGRAVDPRALWHYDRVERVRPLIVHMLAHEPWHVGFTFSAVDSPQQVSDAIGTIFDAVLEVSHDADTDIGDMAPWRHRARDIDYRVVVASGWNIVDASTVPISLFGAGGGVTAKPSW